MKRSEMLSKIKYVVNEVRKNSCDLECQILDIIEGSGMTPPKYEPFPGSDWSNEIRAWEPEDA